MNQNNTVETIIGAIVVAVAVFFIVFAYRSTSAGGFGEGYELQADLSRVDGISVGTDVRLSGVKVGAISDMSLKPNYLVNVKLHIADGIQIPTDSSLIVTSSGVLGSSYLSIQPGGDDTMMKPGDKFGHAQGSVDLMGIVGRFINNSGGGQQQPAQKPPAPKPAANNPPQPKTNGPAPLPPGPGP